MPSVVDNQIRWTEHPWERAGHEWSPGGTAAGGEMLWWRGLLPRIHAHVPTGTALEIGPGFGRWTQHLLGLSAHLTIVDVTERCIEHCRERFAGYPHLESWANDGQSLEMIADGSLDFVFSFDSLVHAEAPVLRGYLGQLARKLKPGGAGFIHHSNLAALRGADERIPEWVVRRNWRGESMSAALFRDYCREAGLACTTQEIITWVSRSRRADRHRIPGWGMPLTDALSTFRRPRAGERTGATHVYVNHRFAEEWRQIVDLAAIYGRRRDDAVDDDAAPSSSPALGRVIRVVRAAGITGAAVRAASRARDTASEMTSAWRERRIAQRVRREDPIAGSLRRGRCPACQAALDRGRCGRCDIFYRGR
jgi:SAM-dependent methyltransferase